MKTVEKYPSLLNSNHNHNSNPKSDHIQDLESVTVYHGNTSVTALVVNDGGRGNYRYCKSCSYYNSVCI